MTTVIAGETNTSLLNTAHIWWLDLAEVPEDAWISWRVALDEEECARADRFVQVVDRRQFIAAHALLRAMLCRFAGLPPDRWRFVTGSYGKPALHPLHKMDYLEFNISHTRGAVACGMVQDCPIGVDIEDEGRSGNHLDIADAYFAPSEVVQLRAVPVPTGKKLFFLLWTLKEAYLKASGKGLSIPLDCFAFSLPSIDVSFKPPLLDRPSDWQFASIRCTSSHRMSVAIRTTNLIKVLPGQVSYSEIERLLSLSRPV